MSTSGSAAFLLGLYAHLTPRDRDLLASLDEHLVLTTSQIHRLHYRSLRTCQGRLQRLYELGLLERFRFAREAWHWALGLHGARLRASVSGHATPTEHTHRHQLIRLAGSPVLAHLLASNELAVRLAAAARANTGRRLDRWWSERTATARFRRKVRPDAHGLWTAGEHTVGWFLETDMGTASLARVINKLAAYNALAETGGPRYPVLFWLASHVREAHLQDALRRVEPAIPVATATQDADPAAAVWLPADGWQRVRLEQLPAEHGTNVACNPNWRDGALDLTGDWPTLRSSGAAEPGSAADR